MLKKVSIKGSGEEPYYCRHTTHLSLVWNHWVLSWKRRWRGKVVLEEYNQRVRDFNDGKPVNTFKVIPAKICRIIIERAGLIYKETA